MAAASRARQPNRSYFAFTAAPKFRTRHVFDEPGASGAAPFHLYSMRQAIEEGFILSVLQSYTTHKRYYALVKQAEGDPLVKRKKAAKQLARFVEIHSYNVAQVTEIVVEHFWTHVAHEMGGRAKAMVVTGSRLAATRYKRAFDEYIESKGYKGLSALVAFSGTVDDPKLPGVPLTESAMNGGLAEHELPKAFGTADHQVLIVADKYQTGFDQPLLQAMYVVRPLTGVKAVQTLSRLNRRAGGKDRTFVLDFVNEAADIQAAFEQFYDGARVEDAPGAHRLYELQHEVFETQVVTQDDIDAFARAYFRLGRQGARMHSAMERVLSGIEVEFRAQDDEVRNHVRSLLGAFQGAYAFLSQVIPFGASDLEQLYALTRHLSPRLR